MTWWLSLFHCGGRNKENGERGQRGMKVNDLTGAIIGAAIEVHRALGPGLLESAYQECLCRELFLRGLRFKRQYPIPLEYKGIKLDKSYQLDLLVENCCVVEIKSIDAIHPICVAQTLTYMRLGNWKVGLIINLHYSPLLLYSLRFLCVLCASAVNGLFLEPIIYFNCLIYFV